MTQPTTSAAGPKAPIATRICRRLARGVRWLVHRPRRAVPSTVLRDRFGYLPQVIDMGDEAGDRCRGIFSPGYDLEVVRQYIQPQFLEYAATYAKIYENFELWKSLLNTAFDKIRLPASQRGKLKILDIGSGSGNTILPLLELCPDAQLLGSDLSLDILVLLKQGLIRKGLDHKCSLLQLNAEELDFPPGTFDLVVGGAILHHLLSPDRTIAGCARILKKGGHAIFIEPFEEGSLEVRSAYLEILAHPLAEELTTQARDFFQAMINDYNARFGTDKSAPIYKQLDDKWLFPRAYFEDLARAHRFAGCTIYTVHDNDVQLQNKTEILLQFAIQQPRSAVPDWAWDILKKHDRAIPKEKKPDCLIEACVIFHR